MARAKLGLASSLEAARLVAAAEEYKGLGSQASDLADAPRIAQSGAAAEPMPGPMRRGSGWRSIPILIGAITMSLIIGLAALAWQAAAPDVPPAAPLPSAPAAVASGSTPATVNETLDSMKLRPASPEEVRILLVQSFSTLDKDRSGFIERREAPASGIGLGPSQPGGQPLKPMGTDDRVTRVTGTMGQAMWISNADVNGDGKVDEAEYVYWATPFFTSRGVPADWSPAPPSGRTARAIQQR